MLQIVATRAEVWTDLRRVELIFKLPKDKPPFIGVLFDHLDWRGRYLNQDVISDFAGATFTGSVDVGASEFTLRSPATYFQPRTYQVEINVEALKSFLERQNDPEYFNFGHVLDNNGKHELATTLRWEKPFVIRLERFTVTDVTVITP